MATSSVQTTLTTGHIGLNVTDLVRSKQFYQQVFDFEVVGESQEAGQRFVLLAADGKLLLTLWEQSAGRFDKQQPGLHHLAFQVDGIADVRRFEQRLHALGATFLYESVVAHREGADSGGIFFEDPDGVRLEIYTAHGVSGEAAPTGQAPTCGFF